MKQNHVTEFVSKTWVPSDGGRSAAGFKERRDCTVRALSVAKGIPYSEAHETLRKLGRKNNCGTNWAKVAAQIGFAPAPELSCVSVKTALAAMQQGIFVETQESS